MKRGKKKHPHPESAQNKQEVEYPIATVAYYGPDDRTPIKVAVGIIEEPYGETVAIARWMSREDIVNDPKVQGKIVDFIKQNKARTIVITNGVIGCIHEEGLDYPEGEECPFCKFWKGKQHSKERFGTVTVLRVDDLNLPGEFN
jgi:hypothetical protein